MHHKRLRNKYTAALIQSADSLNGTLHQIWNQGLLGEGEIIGISDTGIDHESCFFRDDNVTLPTCKGVGYVRTKGCINQAHRKIVTYRYFNDTDTTDEADGHGTHVCGSAAGSLITSPAAAGGNHTAAAASSSAATAAAYQGMAPGAKLAFDDIGVNNSEYLNVPEDLDELLFPHSYAARARIYSMSWGSDWAGYDSTSMETDAFAWEHPTFLPLVAAGNAGPDPATVGAPATAKNILAVGASGHAAAALAAYGLFRTPAVRLRLPDGDRLYPAVPAEFGPDVWGAAVGTWAGPAGAARPLSACGNVTNASVAGRVALVAVGECEAVDKVLRAQRAGAVAVIAVANVPGAAPWSMRPAAADEAAAAAEVRIPAVMVSWADGQAILALLAGNGSAAGAHTAVTASLPDAVDVPDLRSADRLARFSSRGPTLDGRVKPDVVCPGEYIRSARAHGYDVFDPATQCGALLEMSGTSMATPTCAGAAALVREYFRRGFYPAGVPAAAGQINATAALVKSVLIHSARPLLVDDGPAGWAYPESLPDMSQGYGRVDLSHVLRFAAGAPGGAAGPPSLYVADARAVDDGGAFERCVSVPPAPAAAWPLRATLCWTDPPSYPGTGRILVNDLDLVVVGRAGSGWRYYLGNNRTDLEWDGPGYAAVDASNNCEQVTLPPAGGANYTLRVLGADVPLGPQPFALVVTGGAVSAGPCVYPQSAPPPLCPGGCAGHGACLAGGRCECALGHAGADCGRPLPVLACDSEVEVAVAGFKWLYLVLGLPDPAWAWSLETSWPYGQYPGFYATMGRMPEGWWDCDVCLVPWANASNESYSYYYYYYDYYNGSYADGEDLQTGLAECDSDCAAYELSLLDPAAAAMWVLGITAFTAGGANATLRLSCYPPPPPEIVTPPPQPAGGGGAAAVPEVRLQMRTQYAPSEFNATVRGAFARAIAAAAGARESQVQINASVVNATARRSDPRLRPDGRAPDFLADITDKPEPGGGYNTGIGQNLPVGAANGAPRRALAAAREVVVVNATVRGLASVDTAAAAAAQLSEGRINGQLRAAGLRSVVVTLPPRVVVVAADGAGAGGAATNTTAVMAPQTTAASGPAAAAGTSSGFETTTRPPARIISSGARAAERGWRLWALPVALSGCAAASVLYRSRFVDHD